ncbi:hypothetical protein PS732_02466 [Pseudomonas fluorescens]|uniref:Uncharacterized protein n=1 Tax=Pseudomonas fluorescens TaxID=294 RepID=A0ABD7VFX4_PSEFL|nr:hypothetical protein [Pseudomonas fluorescens]VVO93187.1 hypothetical protein PS732_02466 [Pseudomonas fluorescens]
MTNNFKPGDLAMIVDSRARHANVGRVVSLIESLGSPSVYFWEGVEYRNTTLSQVWVIEVHGEPLEARRKVHVMRGPICEYKLMPLAGDPFIEQQKAKEAELCA